MKIATLDIAQPYKVTVVPTQMRYSLLRDMFELDSQKVCEISYEILAQKYVKLVPKLDENGQPVLRYNKPVMDEVIVDFATPVLFDAGSKVIPYQLYLAIEQQRAFPSLEGLAAINTALAGFSFEGSLTDFVLAVTDIQ